MLFLILNITVYFSILYRVVHKLTMEPGDPGFNDAPSEATMSFSLENARLYTSRGFLL